MNSNTGEPAPGLKQSMWAQECRSTSPRKQNFGGQPTSSGSNRQYVQSDPQIMQQPQYNTPSPLWVPDMIGGQTPYQPTYGGAITVGQAANEYWHGEPNLNQQAHDGTIVTKEIFNAQWHGRQEIAPPHFHSQPVAQAPYHQLQPHPPPQATYAHFQYSPADQNLPQQIQYMSPARLPQYQNQYIIDRQNGNREDNTSMYDQFTNYDESPHMHRGQAFAPRSSETNYGPPAPNGGYGMAIQTPTTQPNQYGTNMVPRAPGPRAAASHIGIGQSNNHGGQIGGQENPRSAKVPTSEPDLEFFRSIGAYTQQLAEVRKDCSECVRAAKIISHCKGYVKNILLGRSPSREYVEICEMALRKRIAFDNNEEFTLCEHCPTTFIQRNQARYIERLTRSCYGKRNRYDAPYNELDKFADWKLPEDTAHLNTPVEAAELNEGPEANTAVVQQPSGHSQIEAVDSQEEPELEATVPEAFEPSQIGAVDSQEEPEPEATVPEIPEQSQIRAGDLQKASETEPIVQVLPEQSQIGAVDLQKASEAEPIVQELPEQSQIGAVDLQRASEAGLIVQELPEESQVQDVDLRKKPALESVITEPTEQVQIEPVGLQKEIELEPMIQESPEPLQTTVHQNLHGYPGTVKQEDILIVEQETGMMAEIHARVDRQGSSNCLSSWFRALVAFLALLSAFGGITILATVLSADTQLRQATLAHNYWSQPENQGLDTTQCEWDYTPPPPAPSVIIPPAPSATRNATGTKIADAPLPSGTEGDQNGATPTPTPPDSELSKAIFDFMFESFNTPTKIGIYLVGSAATGALIHYGPGLWAQMRAN